MPFFNTTAQGTLPLIRCLSFGICLGSFNSRPWFPKMLGPLSLRSRSHHTPASQSPIMWLHLFLLGKMMPFKERTQMGTTSAFPGNTQVSETMLEDEHFSSSLSSRFIIPWDMNPIWMWPIATLLVSIREGSQTVKEPSGMGTVKEQ